MNFFSQTIFQKHTPHPPPLSALSFTQHCKIFSEHFPECNQTRKKKSFSLKSFSFENILQWKIFYSETNGALFVKMFWFWFWFFLTTHLGLCFFKNCYISLSKLYDEKKDELNFILKVIMSWWDLWIDKSRLIWVFGF